MRGGTLLFGVVALGIGIAYGPQLLERLPAPVSGFLTRLGGSEDAVETLLISTRKMNDLTVFGAQLVSLVRTEHDGLIDALDTTTFVIVPGQVRYTVNLAALDRAALSWDAKTQRLIVVVPDPVPTDPNIDGARARVLIDGIDLENGDKRQRVLQKSLAVARADIVKKARDPQLLGAARDAGRAALEATFAAPLRAAGLNPTVTVRFKSEALLKG